jgi:hypothetical protein
LWRRYLRECDWRLQVSMSSWQVRWW